MKTTTRLGFCVAFGLVALGCPDTTTQPNNATNHLNNTNNPPDMADDMTGDMTPPRPDMTPPEDMPVDMPPIEAAFKISTRPALVWKRRDALVLDLSRALGLPPERLCNELELAPCAQIHQVSLGANDPLLLGMYVPVGSPLATTPAVVDRMVLASCASATASAQDGANALFASLDWGSATAPQEAEGQDAHTTELYRRFLSRDPTSQELTVARDLATDAAGQPLALEDYAKLSCYAVGSLTEFVMY